MSALTKRHHTKTHSGHEAILDLIYRGHVYRIPKSVAEKYEDKSKVAHRVLPEDIFANIEKKYTKAGVLLRGTRHREGLTQVEMAKKSTLPKQIYLKWKVANGLLVRLLQNGLKRYLALITVIFCKLITVALSYPQKLWVSL